MSTPPAGISLVIPTYNRAALIAETIDSALRQHRPFEEIIVVDDGSTDNTAEVLARFGARIQVIRLRNGGVQRARNTGVATARSDWVSLCDSDDLLAPEFSTTMADWLQAQPECDAVYCNFIPFNDSGDQADKLALAPAGFFDDARCTGQFWHDIPDLYRRTVSYQPLFPSGSVIRKSLYQQIGGYDPRFNHVGSEDWEFTLRLIAAGRVHLCATPLVRIRKHGGNESADTMRQVSGCVQILEYALDHHPIAQQYLAAIQQSIDERRIGVFNGAFARGAFDLAADTFAQLRERPRDRRFRIKVLITLLPSMLRQPLWRLSGAGRAQRESGAGKKMSLL